MGPDNYSLISALFPKLLGIIYFIAFGGFLFQIKGLLGEKGILPIKAFLRYIKMRIGPSGYFYVPTLFWFNSGNKALVSVVATGTLCSLLLIINNDPAYTPIFLILLAILHLSIVSAGQDFLSFGWETTLLEITYITIFLSLSSPPNPFIWISLNLLLFRLHFEGGMSKLLSHDKNWRNLTAVAFHYQSQPIPNVIAWYVHKLPLSFHKVSCALMLFIEIVVPFAIFLSEDIRGITFLLLLGLQLMILLTGNFSYLNWMTILFSTILISNHYLNHLLQPKSWEFLDATLWCSIVGVIFILLQLASLWNFLLPTKKILIRLFSWIEPFHPINKHGIFAVMTTKRLEIVIEGSNDQINWYEYTFFFKPSEITRRPRWFAPYHPRLDWRVWFLPFTNYASSYWFQQFIECLLLGSSDVLKLIRKNPFPNEPPLFIRVLLYDYEFSDKETKKNTNVWWKRTLISSYSPILTLNRHENRLLA